MSGALRKRRERRKGTWLTGIGDEERRDVSDERERDVRGVGDEVGVDFFFFFGAHSPPGLFLGGIARWVYFEATGDTFCVAVGVAAIPRFGMVFLFA